MGHAGFSCELGGHTLGFLQKICMWVELYASVLVTSVSRAEQWQSSVSLPLLF